MKSKVQFFPRMAMGLFLLQAAAIIVDTTMV